MHVIIHIWEGIKFSTFQFIYLYVVFTFHFETLTAHQVKFKQKGSKYEQSANFILQILLLFRSKQHTTLFKFTECARIWKVRLSNVRLLTRKYFPKFMHVKNVWMHRKEICVINIYVSGIYTCIFKNIWRLSLVYRISSFLWSEYVGWYFFFRDKNGRKMSHYGYKSNCWKTKQKINGSQ